MKICIVHQTGKHNTCHKKGHRFDKINYRPVNAPSDFQRGYVVQRYLLPLLEKERSTMDICRLTVLFIVYQILNSMQIINAWFIFFHYVLVD